jgi:signal transduction histidine kinase
LAEAGIDGLLGANDPTRFLLYQLDLLRRLAELKRFEGSQSGVQDLAKRTRETLHDLSQPLSAVQGRLQLMAAKCSNDDPNQQYYADLVRQVFEITNHVVKIQQIQRDAS